MAARDLLTDGLDATGAPPRPAPAALRYSLATRCVIVAVFVALAWPFRSALGWLWAVWVERPEYSHGPMLPLIAAFLIWQRRAALAAAEFTGSFAGVALLGAAAAVYALGVLGAVYTLQQYALVLALAGLAIALTGLRPARVLLVPALFLVLMVPPPNVILNNLSAQLQLLSSALGVALIRAAGVSVFLEGNVIDLGGYRLQVVEACDGLRYLFPLMTLGLLIAYFYRGPFWKRALVFLAAVPITVLMNSLRVGTIGILVEHWGARMADGFLHDFQGWMVFMLSAALLVAFAVGLNGVGRRTWPWREVFQVPTVAAGAPQERRARGALPASFLVAAAGVALLAALSASLPHWRDAAPARESFVAFPDQLGPLHATRRALEPSLLDALDLDDYLLADFADGAGAVTNLYVSYYASQRDRRVVHSPRACIPGGGWQIERMDRVELPGAQGQANRLVITNGDARELVYYWFDQRGRTLTGEWAVKWYLFRDAALMQRTDGAMIRLVTPIAVGEDPEAAEQRLAALARRVLPVLPRFVPR